MKLEKADVLTPQNLRVVDNTAATMKLSWDAPSSSTTDVNDDFEQYEAWGTSFGAWTTVDNDHGFAGISSMEYSITTKVRRSHSSIGNQLTSSRELTAMFCHTQERRLQPQSTRLTTWVTTILMLTTGSSVRNCQEKHRPYTSG